MSTRRYTKARIAPRRRRTQWLCTLLLLAVPFLKVGGDSLLRLDAGSRTLLFFGAKLRIEEFYLFLIVLLILVFGFLFVTMLFGRVWCGWLCPQTALTDLADRIDARLRRVRPAPLRGALRQTAYAAVSALVACNLIWYFIEPPRFFERLSSGAMGPVAGTTLVVTFLLVFFDLALVRRTFCKTVCPYGRIQLMTMDRGTLTLEFDPELKGECLRCGACVRACPTGIDIRDGLQVECINCGRCLDACRDVMASREAGGLIHYTFGSGAGAAGNRRALWPAGMILLLLALLIAGVTTRKEATLKVQRAASAEVKRLSDGTLVNFYTVYLENRGTSPAVFSLEVGHLPGFKAELVGPVRDLSVPANSNRKADVVLKVKPAPAAGMLMELRLAKGGKVVAASPLPVAVD